MGWNKKANLKEVVIYVLLALAVFSLGYVFVEWKGGQSSFYEEVYAKKIVLSIDKAKPGSEIDYDVSELYRRAKKSGFKGKVVVIDNNENRVRVQLVDGGGYDFNYFNSADIVWELKDETLKMKVVGGDLG